MQLRPELEAQEIYHRIRTDTHASDLGAFFHEATNDSVDVTLQHKPQQQERQQNQQHKRNPESLQHQQQQQRPHQHIPQYPSQQQDLNTFLQTAYTTTGPTKQLPPLRSIAGIPTTGIDTTQQQPPQSFRTLTQRSMSQVSAMSSGSYTSLPSSDGDSEQSLSPKADRLPRWAHSINN